MDLAIRSSILGKNKIFFTSAEVQTGWDTPSFFLVGSGPFPEGDFKAVECEGLSNAKVQNAWWSESTPAPCLNGAYRYTITFTFAIKYLLLYCYCFSFITFYIILVYILTFVGRVAQSV